MGRDRARPATVLAIFASCRGGGVARRQCANVARDRRNMDATGVKLTAARIGRIIHLGVGSLIHVNMAADCPLSETSSREQDSSEKTGRPPVAVLHTASTARRERKNNEPNLRDRTTALASALSKFRPPGNAVSESKTPKTRSKSYVKKAKIVSICCPTYFRAIGGCNKRCGECADHPQHGGSGLYRLQRIRPYDKHGSVCFRDAGSFVSRNCDQVY